MSIHPGEAWCVWGWAGNVWSYQYLRLTCAPHENMLNACRKWIQVRNVPDGIHRCLKARAVDGGIWSNFDYLLGELKEIAERPTLAEFRERLLGRMPVSADLDTAEILLLRGTCRTQMIVLDAGRSIDWLPHEPGPASLSISEFTLARTLHTRSLCWIVEFAQS